MTKVTSSNAAKNPVHTNVLLMTCCSPLAPCPKEASVVSSWRTFSIDLTSSLAPQGCPSNPVPGAPTSCLGSIRVTPWVIHGFQASPPNHPKATSELEPSDLAPA